MITTMLGREGPVRLRRGPALVLVLVSVLAVACGAVPTAVVELPPAASARAPDVSLDAGAPVRHWVVRATAPPAPPPPTNATGCVTERDMIAYDASQREAHWKAVAAALEADGGEMVRREGFFTTGHGEGKEYVAGGKRFVVTGYGEDDRSLPGRGTVIQWIARRGLAVYTIQESGQSQDAGIAWICGANPCGGGGVAPAMRDVAIELASGEHFMGALRVEVVGSSYYRWQYRSPRACPPKP
jgi:hypothetical protein